MLNKFAAFLKRTGKSCLLFAAIVLICQGVEAEGKNSLLLKKNPVIAKYGVEYLNLRDIEDRQINQLRRQLYEALNAKMRRTVVDKLSKKYGEFSVSSGTAVSDQEVNKFYYERNLQKHGSLKQLAPQIREYLKGKTLAERYDKLYAKAVRKGLAVSYLKEPDDFLISMETGSAYLRGSGKAKVMLLEFSDYQCPYCSKVQGILSGLRKKYKDRVLFGYRHLPLSFHREADEAAIAVECARDQGKFEAYHEILFKNQRKLGIDDLKRYARQTGIERLKEFDACLDSKKYKARVENDLRTAAEFGISGAPGFVIGFYNAKGKAVSGEILTGALPEREFVRIIEKYLTKTK